MKNIKSILLIEDFEEIRNWLSGLLREAFGEVSIAEAATVAQAFSYLNTKSYDLIVIDLNLPDGTGGRCFAPDQRARFNSTLCRGHRL